MSGAVIRFEVDLHLPPGSEGLAGRVAWVAGLSPADPERHELEAQLYMALARDAWRRADALRAAARVRAARRRGGT